MVGHDTGLIIGDALAADHPDRVDRVTLAEVPGPPGAGQWVAEQAPEELLAALTGFLAPYRDRG